MLPPLCKVFCLSSAISLAWRQKVLLVDAFLLPANKIPRKSTSSSVHNRNARASPLLVYAMEKNDESLHQHETEKEEFLSDSNNGSYDKECTFKCTIPTKLDRELAQDVMATVILPAGEYGNRIRYGKDAQGYTASSTIITADDPRGVFTYGEFPMTSMDALVDLALSHYHKNNESDGKQEHYTMIDLGSGCGRLVFYAALTRGQQHHHQQDGGSSWSIHGIEISDILHDEGLRACLAGMDHGYFQAHDTDNDNPIISQQQPPPSNNNQFTLHRGPAQDFAPLLQQADIVFAYSTAFSTAGFSEALGAMVMGHEWNELLSQNCRPGTVAITTDRALDPALGWNLVERMDVDNREVMGSTGYIHIYQP